MTSSQRFWIGAGLVMSMLGGGLVGAGLPRPDLGTVTLAIDVRMSDAYEKTENLRNSSFVDVEEGFFRSLSRFSGAIEELVVGEVEAQVIWAESDMQIMVEAQGEGSPKAEDLKSEITKLVERREFLPVEIVEFVEVPTRATGFESQVVVVLAVLAGGFLYSLSLVVVAAARKFLRPVLDGTK